MKICINKTFQMELLQNDSKFIELTIFHHW